MIASFDVAVVGGGIAGSALATVLAREGVDVVVLERQRSYADQVRGEGIHPWGVAEALRLGLFDTLVAAGAHITEGEVHYRADLDPSVAESRPSRATGLFDGVPGRLNAAHPVMCESLSAAATAAGATMVWGVSDVEVRTGVRPAVAYSLAGASCRVDCRVVVGADGRGSRVARQIGVRLDRAPATHMIAGLLVDDLDVDDQYDVSGLADRALNVTFPQGRGRARVYLCPGNDDAKRFAGPGGTSRFLRASVIAGAPRGEAWAEATPIGPCRTFPAEDTWTDRPFAEGVVLIGDAAGYNNPLIGQGLGLAFRDVRDVSEVLLDGGADRCEAFAAYGRARGERLRRVRFLAQVKAALNTTFGPERDTLRRAWRRRVREDPSLPRRLSVYGGPDAIDPGLCHEDVRRFIGA